EFRSGAKKNRAGRSNRELYPIPCDGAPVFQGGRARRVSYTRRRVTGCRRNSQLLAADKPNTAAVKKGTLQAVTCPAKAPARSARSRNSGWSRYTPKDSGASVDNSGPRDETMIHRQAYCDMNGPLT